MQKNLRWKTIAILIVTGLAVAAIVPPSKKVHLGLDLQGGIHMVLKVKTDDALRVETETSAEQFYEALKTAKITVGAPKVLNNTDFVVEGVPAAADQQVRTIADQQLVDFDREVVGGTYTFRMRQNIQVQRRAEAVTQAIMTIDKRVNELGVSEPNVGPYGSTGDEIVVELPGVSNTARAKDIIGKTAFLTLNLVEDGPAVDQQTLLSKYAGTGAARHERGSAARCHEPIRRRPSIWCTRCRRSPEKTCARRGRRRTSSISPRSASRSTVRA